MLDGDITAFTVMDTGDIFYVTNKPSQFSSKVMIWDGRKSSLYLELNSYYISEMVPFQEGIAVIARQNQQPWSLYFLDLKTQKFSSLLSLDTPISRLSVEDDILNFTTIKEQSYASYRYDRQSGQVYELGEGNYVKSGVSVDKKLFFFGLDITGEDLYSQQLITKNIYFCTEIFFFNNFTY